jgi:hypothetical protein
MSRQADSHEPPPPATARPGVYASSDGQNSALALTTQACELINQNRYALHPVENTIRALREITGIPCETGDGGLGFESAEVLYRAGAQGLPLSQIPQLPQSLRELSRLGPSDLAGRKHLRLWAEQNGAAQDGTAFDRKWRAQGELHGAEHQVYHDESVGRWFKRFYHGVNSSTLGDYLSRMRLHAVLFPATAYRLEGFLINPKNKELSPLVSQPHIEVDTTRPPVSREETTAAMSSLGFEPLQLKHNGILDDGYYAYYHAPTGVLAHDLHDENVVRMAHTGELAVIDPYISLARAGTWAALKLAEMGLPRKNGQRFRRLS